jgi:hypothetical protein
MTTAAAEATSDLDLQAIETVLADHPMVESVRVAFRTVDGRPHAVATVTPELDCPELEAEQLARWREVYDESFAAGDPTDMLQGWISSYTGEPLPHAEMEEWVEVTAARILDLKPCHVIEIGSGTGLLVERIAPKVESYLAIDGAASCQERLSRLIRARPDLRHVRQQVADAADLPATLRADTVILNSIVQYFPNAAYLARVLDRAISWIDAGAIFIGDVRDLRLLPHFCASLARHWGETDPNEISRFVRGRSTREEELVINPAYFFRFAGKRSQIRHVRPLLKRGSGRNELNRYRYDVVLHIRATGHLPSNIHQIPADFSSVTAISTFLEAHGRHSSVCLTVDNIPNARLISSASAMDPEQVFALGATLGYRVDLAPGPDPERFDAVFYRGDEPPILPHKPSWNGASTAPPTNEPALPLARSLVPAQLRRYLEERLSTVSSSVSIELAGVGEGIGNPSENTSVLDQLVALWRECLQSPAVGPDDDFFACGGSSLLMMQLRKQIADGFGVSVPLSRFAAGASPRAIAAYVQDAANAKAGR